MEALKLHKVVITYKESYIPEGNELRTQGQWQSKQNKKERQETEAFIPGITDHIRKKRRKKRGWPGPESNRHRLTSRCPSQAVPMQAGIYKGGGQWTEWRNV